LSTLHAIRAALLGAAFLLTLTACSTPAPWRGSRAGTVAWASERDFAASELDAGQFKLLALTRQRNPECQTLSVYIEGDGAPWVTPWQAPRDPTPLTPTALLMAAVDPAGAVAYLGRPCQYQSAESLAACSPRWWTDQRFAPDVLAAYDDALTQLKTRLCGQHLRLVGYSGGGVIAAQLTAHRADVAALVTVASPLALTDWGAWHELAPFTNASDPALEPGTLPPGIHWAGGKDRIVPIQIVEKFTQRKGGQLQIQPGYDHECCWARDWARLVAMENPP